MKIILNNNIVVIPNGFTVRQLIEHIGYLKSVAVLINGKQLLSAQYKEYQLKENDNVRIIRILGGG